MKRIDIYHIYWGTAGNAGLYLDEIYQTLKDAGYMQRAFVNYYYPFDYGNKVFFRYGDVGNSKLSPKIRKIVQLLEILYGFFVALFYSFFERPKIINYSHVANSYFFIRAYLRFLHLVSGAKLVVTCHDVNCHLSENELNARKSIFKRADYLLVHTKRSIKELNDYFGIDSAKVLYHLFPIMNLEKVKPAEMKCFSKVDYLFIGHLRKDKGIEFLLEAWKAFHKQNSKAILRVCGKEGSGVKVDVEEYSKYSVDFHLGFVSDEDYYSYIKSTKYVVLPYLEGTNSGVVSTVLSLGAEVITSDLPMFRENPLVSDDNLFKTNDKESLVQLLNAKYNQTPYVIDSLDDYNKRFKDSVLNVYNNLI